MARTGRAVRTDLVGAAIVPLGNIVVPLADKAVAVDVVASVRPLVRGRGRGMGRSRGRVGSGFGFGFGFGFGLGLGLGLGLELELGLELGLGLGLELGLGLGLGDGLFTNLRSSARQLHLAVRVMTDDLPEWSKARKWAP